jgi:hypothetical protein
MEEQLPSETRGNAKRELPVEGDENLARSCWRSRDIAAD